MVYFAQSNINNENTNGNDNNYIYIYHVCLWVVELPSDSALHVWNWHIYPGSSGRKHVIMSPPYEIYIAVVVAFIDTKRSRLTYESYCIYIYIYKYMHIHV